MKIAINGFGRIGRAAFKIVLQRQAMGESIEVAAINDLSSPETLAYLLKYDTVYGKYDKEVSYNETSLIVEGKTYSLTSLKDPSELPWAELEIDVVLECTGAFTKSEDAKKHLTAGAKKVLLSAPATDDGFVTNVLGSENFPD